MASLTYSDLETRIANHLRLPTSNTAEMTKIGAIANEVYRDIGLKYPNWWWLRKAGVVNTTADVTTGTLAATNGSTGITFSSAPTDSATGKVISVTENVLDSGAFYRIASHTAASVSATLDAAYTGTTVTTSAFVVYQDQYSLPTDLKYIREIRRYGVVPLLQKIGPEEMDRIKAYDTSVGKPAVWTVRDFATSGDPTTAQRLIVHPYPDDTYRLELSYLQTLNTEVSSTTRFLIPDDYIQILIYGTLSRAYPIMLADTTRGLYYAGLYNSVLDQLVATQRTYEDLPATQPRDVYRRFYHQQRRRGHASLRSLFGRFPNEP